MIFRIKLVILFFATIARLELCGQTPQIPVDGVKYEYLKLIGEAGYSNVGIPKETIVKLTDKSLMLFLPNVDFYSVVIQNFSHYEYNMGQIKAIVAISKLQCSDVRLLLPLDYSKSSDNFLDLFYANEINVPRDSLFHSIVDIFISTYTINSLLSDNKMDSLLFNNIIHDHSIEVKTKWIEKIPTYKQGKSIIVNVPIQNTFTFYLDRTRIQKITYQHWK